MEVNIRGNLFLVQQAQKQDHQNQIGTEKNAKQETNQQWNGVVEIAGV